MPMTSSLQCIQDSSFGIFSTPHVVVDATHGIDAPGGQENVRNEAESRAYLATLDAPMHEGVGIDSMDLGNEAAAPAFKAPRAP
jgi:hypothetical protein